MVVGWAAGGGGGGEGGEGGVPGGVGCGEGGVRELLGGCEWGPVVVEDAVVGSASPRGGGTLAGCEERLSE